ncbi:methylated-DNA--[protein]-cysteine S-methyltransferase, partial [Weissella soli]|uniref:methylated-DNA--[protein]-cysteine S-methyltransferase n=1 Tax=Weissella soli TaxID=155866 RepID=UPI00359F6B95
ATMVGRPTAVRAVATAVGKNPLPLIVPCHRVVRKDGTIGFSTFTGNSDKFKSTFNSSTFVDNCASIGVIITHSHSLIP